MTLVLIGILGLVLGGLTFKNRGHLGSRYIGSSSRDLVWAHK